VIPTFSLLHTTARLPYGWLEASTEWLRACDHPESVQYVLFVDGEPVPLGKIRGFASFNMIDENGRLLSRPYDNCRVGSANGWNRAAALSTGKFLITISDDYRPCEHWDTEILRLLGGEGSWHMDEVVLDVDNQDGAPHIPFSFLTRAYYNRYGYIFYPEYKGLMADNDFTDVAREDGVVINAKHLRFRHLHYLCGTAPNDEVYQKQQQTLKHGQEVYARRCAERAERRKNVEGLGPHGMVEVRA
jgi:hypothetical protein